MKIADNIFYVGVNDHKVDLFEGQYSVANGMAYNSYVIIDDKIAVMDTVDIHFSDEWLNNISAVFAGRQPDYLVVQHMEPDHSANIDKFIKRYPKATVVANRQAFAMMKQFFCEDFACTKLVVQNGESLSLGKHKLQFVFAPMVHWPEVMVSYESTDKILFSADAFGKFGALDIDDVDKDWACEARRYYFGIVGKYGVQVQKLLQQAKTLDISIICPLHGPVLTENISDYLNLYDIWSSYKPEDKGVCIAYASAYSHTRRAAELLADMLEKKGCPKVTLFDLARSDIAEAVEDAFRYDRLVLASSTYNAGIFPFMRHFIGALTERNFQNRKVGLIENGSWAPAAARVMKSKLEDCKNLTFLNTVVTIHSSLDSKAQKDLEAMADELCAN